VVSETRDLLVLAATMLEAPLPHAWATPGCPCGAYCLRCACSAAATELDPQDPIASVFQIARTGRSAFDAILERAIDYVRRTIGTDAKVLERDEALIAINICVQLCELDDIAREREVKRP
jgi:hypothetical protein